VNLGARDKRALVLLGVVLALTLVYLNVSSAPLPVVSAVGSIPIAEKRLAALRQRIAASPASQKILEKLSADAAAREKNLITAETAPQAQAQVLQILRRLCNNQAPPLEVRGVELGPIRPLGDAYGEALVTVSFEAQIHQLVNLLADLTAQPELLATEDLRIAAADQRQKTMLVRMTVAGVVPRRLVPEKKGLL
jgi:hypothetical protein